MERGDISYAKLLKDLRDAVSFAAPASATINSTLDKLIYLLYSKIPLPSDERSQVFLEVKRCVEILGLENPLLLAKCSNVFLGLISTHHIPLTEDEIDYIVSWACHCLADTPDIVYTDFLQMLNALIKREPGYFESERSHLLEALTSKLEDKANVSLPQNILLCRLSCLKTLSTCAPVDALQTIASSYFDAAFNLKKSDSGQFNCQVWMKVLEGLKTLFSLSQEWVKPALQHLVVAIHSAMTVGLAVSPSPTLQFPAHMVIPPPSKLPSIRPIVKLKRKKKSKSKPVSWSESDHQSLPDSDAMVQIETTSWISSDSEYSDSEFGEAKRIKKLEAHVRHAAYNLLIHFIKAVGCRSVFDWLCALFSRLIDAVQRETYSKPRCAVFGALTALLSDSKSFLAQAQYNDSKSFTSFSGVLAEQLTSLHAALILSLKNVPLSDKQQLTALFVATGSLIKVTPYSRLQPTIFTSLMATIQTFTHHKDLYVVGCTLQCLIDVVILPSWDNSASDAIATPKSEDNKPWMLKYAMSYLDEDTSGIRVFAWAVLSGLCQNHFTVVEPYIFEVEKIILDDLSVNKSSMVSPMKALACLLEKYSSNASYTARVDDLWDRLLEHGSPFLSAIQEPGKAVAAACACLSLIGSRKFLMLTEEKKILIITLVFGCCNSEVPVVRYTAFQALNSFLLYPQMSEEIQFICDAKDHLIRGMKDPMQIVKVKASWAFGNLVDLLVESRDEELLAEISIFELLQAALVLPDSQKVRQNVLRAIGGIPLLLTAEDVQSPKWQELLEKSCLMLQDCASSGGLMKMRWNACRALAIMLTNEVLYDTLTPLMPNLIQSLCTIIVGCNNFKVRMNACLALSSIKTRQLYGALFFAVWQALLDGLDNSANMPDFSEFQHQHGLQENLCAAICHMVGFLQPNDLTEMQDSLSPRLDSLSQYLRQYQERITPEQGITLLSAIDHIKVLVKSSGNEFANDLLVAFEASQM